MLHSVEIARAAGIDLKPVSSFRDFDRQVSIWNSKYDGQRPLLDAAGHALDASALSPADRVDAILRWSALPGASRHHWGTDIDLIDANAVAPDYNVQLIPEEFEPAGPFAHCRAWVIDFKTGSDSSLTDRRLQKGQGLQIALYGLGLRALGAEAVTLSVLTPGAELKRQLADEKVLAMQEPFRTIDAIHRTGVFGQSPAEDREHGFAPDYPMTTRAVAHDVLQAKWAIEHGGEGA